MDVATNLSLYSGTWPYSKNDTLYVDQVSALFIQIKNRRRALYQNLTKEGWGRCFDWNEAKVPVLFLQLELGVKNPEQHFKHVMSEFPEVHAGRVVGFSNERPPGR